MKNVIAAASILMMGAVGPALAEKAHIHGHGTLNIAIEGAIIEMELQAPGSDIIGFEHAAQTDGDKAKLHAAYGLFETPQKLFTLSSGAGCKPVHLDVHYTKDPDHGKHAGHKDDADHDSHVGHEVHDGRGEHDKHDGHDEHAGHEGHGPDADHDTQHLSAHKHSDTGGEHGEFHAHYKFKCGNTGALSAIRFRYFKKFSGASELKVNIITAKGQKSFEVSRDEPALDLSGLL